MASFTTTHYFKTLIFIILFLKALSFDPTPLFSFADFEKDLKFKSNVVALYGNAKVVKGESKIQFFSGSESSGAGRVIYKKSIKLFQGKPKQLVSFSTYFTFSISKENGDGGGLAFVVIPNGSEGDVFNQSSLSNRDFEVTGIGFSASRDNRNEVFTSLNGRSKNLPTKLGLKSGEKLHAWIDYEASSRRLEVRLSQHGKNSRPSDPLLWHTIDLSNVLKEKQVFVGLSPVKGLKGTVFLYSWSFVLRQFPHSVMHSEPLDPKVFVKNIKTPVVKPRERERSDCVLRVLAAMIFGTGCGALIAFIGLYLWTIFGSKRAVVVPEGCVMQPVDVEYRKVKIVVDDTKTIVDDGKSIFLSGNLCL